MYKEHPCFIAPADENARIWRYMDFAKFVGMLDTHSLHFTRIDCFKDRFEGSLPVRHVENLRRARGERRAKHPKESEILEIWGIQHSSPTEIHQKLRPASAANCWHQNEHESMAMWSQYLKSGEGIAIRSTYKQLIDAFDDQDDTLLIYVGMVRYIDYENDVIESFNNVLLPMIHKGISFRHEQELRAVALGARRNGQKHSLDMREFPQSGIDVAVDLNQLVESVYVAPGVSQWFRSAVESVTRKYGLSDVPIMQSSLDSEPVW